MKDYYQILEIHPGARKEIIQNAYRTLAKIFHPDNPEGNADTMLLVNEAYEILMDDEKREEYDRRLGSKQTKDALRNHIHTLELEIQQRERALRLKEAELKRKERELKLKEEEFNEKRDKDKKIRDLKLKHELEDKINSLGDTEIPESKKYKVLREIIRESRFSTRLLVDAFPGANSEMRYFLLQALGEIGYSGTDIYEAGLKDESPAVRAEAAHHAGVLKIKSVSPYLIPLLDDKDKQVKQEACFAAGETGLYEAAEYLVKIAGNKKEETELRVTAIAALGKCGNEKNLSEISALSQDKNSIIVDAVSKAQFTLNQRLLLKNVFN